VVPSGDTAAGAKCDAVWFSPRKKRRRRRRRRSTGWRRKRRRWRRRAAAMASVTGHCIWFHGKWAQSYSWVEIVKISRGYPPLNWIAATCVYPLSSSSVRLSLSLSRALFALSPSTHSPAFLCRGNCAVLFRLYSRARALSLATRRSRERGETVGRRHVVKSKRDATPRSFTGGGARKTGKMAPLLAVSLARLRRLFFSSCHWNFKNPAASIRIREFPVET